MAKKSVNAALASRVNSIVARHAGKAAVARQAAPKGDEKRAWYNFVNKNADEADLFIYDEISSWWGVSANDFVRDLQDVEVKTINLYINSPGGSVFEGYAIYAALVRHSEKNGIAINVTIDGWAASIASVIAMAGDKITIGAHAQVMIHEPWGYAIGTAQEMRDEADVLDDLKDTIVDIYVARTDGDRDEITAWVEAETWFKGQAAVDAGFADEVVALKTKKTDDDAEDKARPAATADANYFKAIFPNIPDDVSTHLTAGADSKALPSTTRQFRSFLQKHGYTRDGADAIAAHGFKPKTEPRDGAVVELEKPTTLDPRDGAEKRDQAVAAIRQAANLAAIRSAARP